jgi:hypothetical protein
MAQRVKWQMVWTAAASTWWLESTSPISLEHELEEAALMVGALQLGQVADHGDGQLGAAAQAAGRARPSSVSRTGWPR